MEPTQTYSLPKLNRRNILLIKSVHSAIYVWMSACVLYILYCGITGTQNLLLWLAMGFIGVELLALALNRGRCPLTTLALHYGDKTGDDLIADWLLPAWSVRLTVPFCGFLMITGVVLIVLRLLGVFPG